jgi:hypothetical protein
MASIAVTGKSGTGKSTSYIPNEELGIKGLHPKETLIINVSKKPLPGRKTDKFYPIFDKIEGKNKQEKIDNIVLQIKNKKRQLRVDHPGRIISIMDAIDCCCPEIKNIVIDDSQYIQGFMVMNRITEQGWSKFNDVALAGFGPVDAARNLKRSDLLVFFLYHPETNDQGDMKIKTAGKAVDQYITLDGLFTVNLYTDVEFDPSEKKPVYKFRTQTLGSDSCKSPYGMFDDLYIPNDLGLVREKYIEYYN